MGNDLTARVNIGKELNQQLNKIGIDTLKKLISTGSEAAFLKIQAIDNTACLNMLYALEGAIVGIRWHHLPKERKLEFKIFFKSSTKKM
jgi:DNA transformation protein and related proteins